ncbi:MAG: glycine--tRNA ligase subunit beta [Proteobacteria bacterium]|nr:glycine--tRNA ligase subunit beta [Pseudomonadota bacterium]
MSSILFELGSEELPPKTLNNLAKSLYTGVVAELDKAAIKFDKENSRWFASPRRLAFILNNIDKSQADVSMQRKGPAVVAAFDDAGNAQPAALGFAKSVGVEVSDLQRLKTDKGEWLVYDITKVGKKTSELLPEFIRNSIKKMPIPKPMRWGNYDFSFIRPVHWMVLLQDEQVIPFEMFAITAGNQTRGHRFHAPDFITINSALTYVQQLLDVRVHVDQIARKENVKQQALTVAQAINGRTKIDDGLLEEVTAMVEYPVAVVGAFAQDFLQVPAEALISSMQKHQKYFPIFDAENKLMPNFVALANIESSDPIQVVKGFEKVIRPRLADARFFWEQDQKQPLEDNFAMLEKMTFAQNLGSIGDKCNRIAHVMAFFADSLELDKSQAMRAAKLSKCDLVTDMVNEFPDLQGIMGGYYAAAQKEDVAVAQALTAQYKPAFSGDTIPTTALAQLLAVVDKMDTLCAIFAIGKKPTGNKDPFALRRAALGIIRILQLGKLPLSINKTIEVCLEKITIDNIDKISLQQEIKEFIMQRLKHSYLESGLSHDVVDAVLTVASDNLADCDIRAKACQEFKLDTSAPALAAANKRITNILQKSNEVMPQSITMSLLKEERERNLFGAIEAIKGKFIQEIFQQKYGDAFKLLTSLASPVDDFFDTVMVNSDDQEIRLNRLALLKQLNELFNAIADISKLEI